MTTDPTPTFPPADLLAALTLEGADAVSFAQRILANDVAALDVGNWQWNCLLSPQGRVHSLFRLWRRGSDVLTLVLPGIALASTRALLSRYLLRAKVAIDTGAELSVESEPAKEIVLESVGDRLRSSDGRSIVLGGDPARAIDSAYRSTAAAWRAQELAQGVPWLDPEAAEMFTPQALSLDRLNAYSVRKGCYPGQEIVARMHFLGQNKRELRRFASHSMVELGATLMTAGENSRAVGRVVMSHHVADNVCEILAVCQRVEIDVPLLADAAAGDLLASRPLQSPPLPL